MVDRLTWEYHVESRPDRKRLNALGAEGWELTGVGTGQDEGQFYFKRPGADLRERVTLDHRQRFVDAARQSGREG